MSKKENIEQTCKRLSLGRTKLGLASDIINDEVNVIPTGCVLIDCDLLQHGGWPCGQMSLIWGQTDVGKSLVTLWTIAKAQETYPDKKAVLIDTEGRTNDLTAKKWMEHHGINLENLIILPSRHLEKILPVMATLARRDDISIIVWDTISDSFSRSMDSNFEAETDKSPGTAAVARKISEAMPYIMEEICANSICFLIVAQNRAKINMSGYGSGGFRPGVPQQIMHEAAVRMYFRKTEDVKESGKKVGWKLYVGVEKGKGYATTGKTTVDSGEGNIVLMFGECKPDNRGAILDDAIRLGIVMAAGSWYSWGDIKLQGRANFRDALTDEQFEQIKEETLKLKEVMPIEVEEEI